MIAVNGNPCKSASLRLPWSGCWECALQWEGKGLAGQVVIDWRGWKLTGTIDPLRSGLFAGEPAGVVVGGYAWTLRREWRPLTDDRGLTSRSIAVAVAEQLGQPISIELERPIGKHFVQRTASGGQILTHLFGRDWHVGTDGTARAQVRATPATGKSVRVLDVDHRDGRITVYADRPDQVQIGCILPTDERLRTRRRVVKLFVTTTGDKERLVCYTESP